MAGWMDHSAQTQRIALGILIMMLGLPVGQSWADKVFVKGESSPIEGKVISVSDQEVVVVISEGRQLPLARTAVLKMELDSPLPAAVAPVPASPPRSGAIAPSSSQGPILSLPAVPETTASTFPPLRQPVNGPINQLMYSPAVPLYEMITEKGELNEKLLVSLSRFKGQMSQMQYVGLYNFNNKGTFWIRLPQAMDRSADLTFSLFGKQSKPAGPNKDEHPLDSPAGPEAFNLQARFLGESGQVIQTSPVVSYPVQSGALVEWFQLLEGMSGLCDPVDVHLSVPPGTKVVEFRVLGEPEQARHLVGYLGRLMLSLPQ